ncbi:hypothetical protein MMC24_006882 [Lignoscripta atroalba]|nr:hypothetical protein [Lignoscripta atroalba]
MSNNYRKSVSHEERTAEEPRENDIHHVILSRIQQVNPTVRLLQLNIPKGKQLKARPQFLPGQWLDVFIRGLSEAGGFTITSTPKDAEPSRTTPRNDGYLELAIQKSPKNPPAAWLWRSEEEILGKDLLVRVGGSFVWPPPGVDIKTIQRIAFVAGGVGIKIELVTNRSPLISILAHLYNNLSELPPHIQFLYTTKPASANTDEILFLPRLRALFSSRHSSERRLDLYLTTSTAPSLSLSSAVIGTGNGSPNAVSTHNRRITHHDLLSALGPVEARQGVVAYVCGPPNMTDEFVDVLRKAEGMDERRVLCEKWW